MEASCQRDKRLNDLSGTRQEMTGNLCNVGDLYYNQGGFFLAGFLAYAEV